MTKDIHVKAKEMAITLEVLLEEIQKANQNLRTLRTQITSSIKEYRELVGQELTKK